MKYFSDRIFKNKEECENRAVMLLCFFFFSEMGCIYFYMSDVKFILESKRE